MSITKRTRAEVQELLLRQETSGLSKKAFCHREGINPGTFSWWLKRERKEPCQALPHSPQFVQVRPSLRPPGSAAPRLSVDFPTGIRIQWFGSDVPAGLSSLIGEVSSL